MRDVTEVIASAWNVQGGRKVYKLHLGTSDVDGIMLALCEKRYTILPFWAMNVMALLSGIGVGAIIVGMCELM